MSTRILLIVSLLFLPFKFVFAGYPVLDAAVGLPHPELITVYPDDSDPNMFYFVPTSMSLVFDDQGNPRLGVQYWGLTGTDQNGAGAALTFSVKPTYDKKKVDEVANALKQINPNAKFAFPALTSSNVDLILNGQFQTNHQDRTVPSYMGGTVDSTSAFSVGLNRVGAAAFAQGISPDSDVLGARYRFKITGVAKRLHAQIIIHNKRVYDHFSTRARSSGYFGWFASTWSADWQQLRQDGAIEVRILEGGETDTDAYMIEVFKIIVDAKINGEGMFKPHLQPTDISGGSANIGWGFRVSSSWQHLEESNNLTITIDKKKLEDREFETGLSFSTVCARYPDSFVDITKLGNKCIDRDLFEKTASAVQACIQAKYARYDSLFAQKALTYEQWNEAIEKANNSPCYGVATIASQGNVINTLKNNPGISPTAITKLQNLSNKMPEALPTNLINAIRDSKMR